jgi:tRNA-dependent cyclodipeptide synthase
MRLYEHNSKFKVAVDTTSASVLHNAGQELTDENVQQATHYLLSEIAFLEFAPDYFGVNKIGYVYHKNRFVFEDYVA